METPTQAQIATLAYLYWQERMGSETSGTPESDWLWAEKQLISRLVDRA